jgi:hypothetical protein
MKNKKATTGINPALVVENQSLLVMFHLLGLFYSKAKKNSPAENFPGYCLLICMRQVNNL